MGIHCYLSCSAKTVPEWNSGHVISHNIYLQTDMHSACNPIIPLLNSHTYLSHLTVYLPQWRNSWCWNSLHLWADTLEFSRIYSCSWALTCNYPIIQWIPLPEWLQCHPFLFALLVAFLCPAASPTCMATIVQSPCFCTSCNWPNFSQNKCVWFFWVFVSLSVLFQVFVG